MRAPEDDGRHAARVAADLLRQVGAEHDADRDRVVRRLGFDPVTDTASARLTAGPRPIEPAGSDRPRSSHSGLGRHWSRRESPATRRFAGALPVGVAAMTVAVVAAISFLVALGGPDHRLSTSGPLWGIAATPGPSVTTTPTPPSSIPPPPAPSPVSNVPGPGAPRAVAPSGPVAPVPGSATAPPAAAGPGSAPPAAGGSPGAPPAAGGSPGAPPAAGGSPGAPPAVGGSPGAPPAAPAQAPAGLAPAAFGSAVTLGNGVDWAAVVRRDGTVVRSKHAQLGSLDVRWTGATAGLLSPWRVSWSDGAPEQTHDSAPTWLAIGQGGSATVTVAPLSRAATLTLYVGAEGANVVVSGAGQASWSHPGRDLGPVAVTIPLPASSTSTTVSVAPSNVSPGGVAGLAAATLS